MKRIAILILGVANLLACGYLASTGGSWPIVGLNALAGVLLLYAALDWKRVQ